jgi:hypothetical protein
MVTLAAHGAPERRVKMKKLLFLALAVSALLMACSKNEDMSTPPASGTKTNATSTNK